MAPGFSPSPFALLTVTAGASLSQDFALSVVRVSLSGHVLQGTTPVPGVFLSVRFTPAAGVNCTFQNCGVSVSLSAADGSYTLTGLPGSYEIWAGAGFGCANFICGSNAINSSKLVTVDATPRPRPASPAPTCRSSRWARR